MQDHHYNEECVRNRGEAFDNFPSDPCDGLRLGDKRVHGITMSDVTTIAAMKIAPSVTPMICNRAPSAINWTRRFMLNAIEPSRG